MRSIRSARQRVLEAVGALDDGGRRGRAPRWRGWSQRIAPSRSCGAGDCRRALRSAASASPRQHAAAGGDARTAADRASRRRARVCGSLARCVVEQPFGSRARAARPPRQAACRSRRTPDRWLASTSATVRASSSDIGAHRRAAGQRQLAGDEIDRLDAVGAFVDLGDAGVAIELRGAGLLDEAHAAVDLHAERGDLGADVGRECLGDRRQQRGALVRGLRARPRRWRDRERSIATAVA